MNKLKSREALEKLFMNSSLDWNERVEAEKLLKALVEAEEFLMKMHGVMFRATVDGVFMVLPSGKEIYIENREFAKSLK